MSCRIRGARVTTPGVMLASREGPVGIEYPEYTPPRFVAYSLMGEGRCGIGSNPCQEGARALRWADAQRSVQA